MIQVLNFKTEKITGILENKTGSALYWNDQHRKSLKNNEEYFNFTMQANVPAAEHFAKQNRVLIPDEDGAFVEFIIQDTAQFSNRTKEVRAIASYTELAKEKILDPTVLEGQTINTASDYVLVGTEWQRGITEYAGLHKVVFSEHTKALDALRQIASLFNLELRFRIETRGSRVIGRYVDFLKRIGTNRGKEIVLGKDLIGVTRKENTLNLVTALICLGPEREDGTRLIVRVEDKDALERWGRNGRHLWDVYTPDSTESDMTEERLTQLGHTELRKRINASVQYEVDAASLEHIFGFEHERVFLGDSSRVKDTSFVPPLYLDSRIISIDRAVSTKGKKKFVLGEFIEYKEEDIMKTFRALKGILQQKASASDIQAVREYVEVKAAAAEGAAKEYAEVIVLDAIDTAAQDATQKAAQAEQNAKQFALTEAQKAQVAAINAAAEDATNKANAAKADLETDIAAKADAEWVDGQLVLKEAVITKANVAPASPTANQLWLDTSVTPNQLKRWSGTAWVKATPSTAAEVGAEATVFKQTTAPAHLNGRLWLDTSKTPNVLKRSTGTAWVDATPTTPGHVGAYTKTEVDNAVNSRVAVTTYQADQSGMVTRFEQAESRLTQTETDISTKVSQSTYSQDIGSLSTRMTSAETNIQQTANDLALKANKTDVYTKTESDGQITTVTNRIATAETSIKANADAIALRAVKTEVDTALSNKADTSTVTALTNRVTTAEGQISVQAGEIAARVTTTTFNTELGKKENALTKANAAPSSPSANQLWLDTSVTPNVLKRWSGSAWVKATPTTAAEVGAYSATDGTGLATRLSTAESTITQHATQIASKVAQTDFNSLTNRVTSAESTITQQANQISQKVSQTDYNGNTITSLINQTATTIKMKAERIEFNGSIFGKNATFEGALKAVTGEFAGRLNAVTGSMKSLSLLGEFGGDLVLGTGYFGSGGSIWTDTGNVTLGNDPNETNRNIHLRAADGGSFSLILAGSANLHYQGRKMWNLTDGEQVRYLWPNVWWGDINETGHFRADSNNNGPGGNHIWKYMNQYKHDNSWSMQEITDFDMTRRAIRGKINGNWSNWRYVPMGTFGAVRCYQYAGSRMRGTVNHNMGSWVTSVLATLNWIPGAVSLSYLGVVYVENITSTSFDVVITNMNGQSIPAGSWIDVYWQMII